MKVFIRDKESKEYLFSAGSWTSVEGEALDFETVSRAREFCNAHYLREAEILVQKDFGDPTVVLPSIESRQHATEVLHSAER